MKGCLQRKVEIKNSTWQRYNSVNVIHTTEAIRPIKRKVTAVVLLDISKAFDSIKHCILQQKLQDVGISSLASLGLTVIYLKGNQIVVYTRNCQCHYLLIAAYHKGIISGLSYLVYTWTINHQFLSRCQSESFVNDTKLHISFSIQDWGNWAMTIS